MITLETVLMKQEHSCADKASSAGGYAAYATHSAKTQIEARSTMLDSMNDSVFNCHRFP